MRTTRIFIFSIFAGLLLVSCEEKTTELLWDKSLYQIGSQSSPRTVDLNEDGILDIVMGGGRDEMANTDMGVFALDGKTGAVLWKEEATAHIVGSASFYDITGDGVEDVFIGGRKYNLKAINGKTGDLIWEYSYKFEGDPILKYARFNFYNSTLVPDQNDDGIPDLLTVNGGNWNAAPGSLRDRYPGVLMLLSAGTGAIIAADTMPDGKESYMSPICFSQPGDESLQILFGTGGETVSGQLYLTTLQDLLDRNLANATPIASEEDHGFIAPPVLADLNEDRKLDIIAISHASKIIAVDGVSRQVLWQQSFSGMESSNALAVGNFNGDGVPDVLAVMCRGTWPYYAAAVQVMLDGKSGQIEIQDSIGCFAVSSPVVYDLNGDGTDEAILSINEYDCNMKFTDDVRAPATINNQLVAFDFRKDRRQVIDRSEGFKNIFSTPWIGDLDEDGYLDIVYCQYLNTKDISKFLGMRVRRISTHIRMKNAPKWGGYMGTEGNGTYE